MRNAQQELNLHVNALQASLDGLKAAIEAMCAAPPGPDGIRAMPWPTPILPSPVVCALLEGYRDAGRDLRIEAASGGLRLALHPDPAVPRPVIA
jgi:hypothetical protein